MIWKNAQESEQREDQAEAATGEVRHVRLLRLPDVGALEGAVVGEVVGAVLIAEFLIIDTIFVIWNGFLY